MTQYNVKKNMEIINEIIEIEANAQNLIKNANREKEELPNKISAVLEEYKARQHKAALEKIKLFRIAEEAEAKKNTERIYREHEQKLEKLKKITDENIGAWVAEVYSFITEPTKIQY